MEAYVKGVGMALKERGVEDWKTRFAVAAEQGGTKVQRHKMRVLPPKNAQVP